MPGIINGFPEKTISGELTFVGVLNKYYDVKDDYPSINYRWKAESTRNQYTNDYKNRIIPKMNLYKALKDYEDSDFKRILENIKKENLYSDEKMSHYRLLIWEVYKAGVTRGDYPDKLMWDVFGVSEEEKEYDAEELRKRVIVTRKSFTKAESKKILDLYQKLTPEKAEGEALGFFMMLFSPLRNQEVCALNFGDISIMTSYKIPCIKVYKSTKINTSTVKAGGKTKNATRIIPMFDFLYEFIIKRRDYIKSLVDDGKLSCESVDDLPVVCQNKFNIRCKSGDISNFAKNLFKKLNINTETLKGIGRDFFKNADIDEKEPTAYLLRRNSCTRLACLDFTDNELQYIMGHDIEDDKRYRNYFVNDDELFSIYNKLKKHPYYKYIVGKENNTHLINEKDFYRNESCTAENIEFDFNKKKKKTITLCLNELSDKVKIQTGDNIICQYKTNRSVLRNNYKDSVDVSKLEKLT